MRTRVVEPLNARGIMVSGARAQAA